MSRQWIELLGHVFFLMPVLPADRLPLLAVLLASPMRSASSRFRPAASPQWPAKGLVLIGFVMLTIQGISEIIKQIAIMRGDLEDADVAPRPCRGGRGGSLAPARPAKEQGLAS